MARDGRYKFTHGITPRLEGQRLAVLLGSTVHMEEETRTIVTNLVLL